MNTALSTNKITPFHSQQAYTFDLLDRVEAVMHALCDADNEHTTSLASAIRYHLAAGGSRTRASLALDCAATLMLDDEQAVSVAAVPELLHNASLVHDDLQDCAINRRGRKAVWLVYGSEIAICVGDQMLSSAYGALAKFPEPVAVPKLLRRVHARVTKVIDGQTRDLASNKKVVCNFSEYESIAAAKSGPLLGLGMELALIAAGFERESQVAASAARNFAIAYQIADDIQDQAEDGAHTVKPSALNAISVLRATGVTNPVAIASLKALRALGRARQAALQLPCGSGASLLVYIDRLKTRLELSA